MAKAKLYHFLTSQCVLSTSSIVPFVRGYRVPHIPSIRHEMASSVVFNPPFFETGDRLSPSAFSRTTCWASFSSERGEDPDLQVEEHSPRDLAYSAISLLAKRGRSWKRLSHLVDMAIENKSKQSIQTAVDVGTDHGLLAVGLSLSGQFNKVLGIDISERALQDGAMSLRETIINQNDTTIDLPVEFRVGDGLRAARIGEADLVCIAGMGANTILKILRQTSTDGILEIETVGCKKLILQPTNSRPRNLMMLYQYLAESGWCVIDERIEKLSSRWYMSSSFVKAKTSDFPQFPGCVLEKVDETSAMKTTFNEYLHHHNSWIRKDGLASGHIHQLDKLWLCHLGDKNSDESEIL